MIMTFDLGRRITICLNNKIDFSSRHFSGRIMKAKSRQDRYKKGYILLEGKRLIADAIQAGADLVTIYVTDRQILDVNIYLSLFQ